MCMELLIEDTRWEAAGLEALATRACEAVLARFGIDPERAEISLLGCDDARIAALNAQFRGRNAPTNVLSWPAREGFPPTERQAQEGAVELGDIAIAHDVCAREAHAQGKTFDDHVTHLLVHGVLHLLGFDHMDEAQAAEMEALEVEILGKLGISNPYG